MNLKQMIKFIFSWLGVEIKRKSELDKFLFSVNSGILARLLYFKRMYDKISNVEGDIVECGVGQTKTFQMLAFLLEQDKDKKRMLWGFDSFEGFPQSTVEDISPRNPKKGEWNCITVEQTYEALRIIQINPQLLKSRVRLVKGFFEEILPEYENKISKIALLHLDCDLYGSYKSCLEHLFPKVVGGGAVLFDEYANAELRFPGAKKAIDEYFHGANYKIQKDEMFGKYFLIKT